MEKSRKIEKAEGESERKNQKEIWREMRLMERKL
jgi:hypothetical protein